MGGQISTTYGSYDRRDLTGALNIPLASNAALRLTGGTLNRDGFVKRADGGPKAGGATNDLIRGQLKWKPADTVEVDLGAMYNRSTSIGSPFAILSVDTTGRTVAAWNTAHAGNPSQLVNAQWISTCNYCQPGTDVDIGGATRYMNASGRIVWHVSDSITLKSLTGYQKVDNTSSGDTDGTPLPVQNVPRITDNMEVWSQEFQLSGKLLDDRLDWVGGLYYYHQNSFLQQFTAQFNAVIPANPYTAHTTTEAAFLDLTYRVTDRLRLIGGLRYSKDHVKVALRSPEGAMLNQGERSFPSTTGRLGLEVQWTPDIMTYVTASRGFRAGGFTQDNGFLTAFDPETVTSYELGARAELFGGKLRLNPTVFYTDWKDIQVQYQLSQGNIRYFVVQNAAKAHTYGAELEAEAAVTSSLRLFGNLALLKMSYDSIGAAQGVTVDSKFPRAPRATYTVGVRHQANFGGLTARSSIDWNWQGKQNSTAGDSDTLHLPSYGVLGARIDVSDPSGNWTVSLFGTNLLNELYYVGGVNYRATVGISKWDLGNPRELGVTVRRRF